MNIEFTQEDFRNLDEMLGNTPFKYAFPIFQFFQGKVQQTKQKEIEAKIKIEENGNQADGQ